MTKNTMTINKMIKKLKQTFGDDLEYRAVSKDGKVFKTQGFDDARQGVDKPFKM